MRCETDLLCRGVHHIVGAHDQHHIEVLHVRVHLTVNPRGEPNAWFVVSCDEFSGELGLLVVVHSGSWGVSSCENSC